MFFLIEIIIEDEIINNKISFKLGYFRYRGIRQKVLENIIQFSRNLLDTKIKIYIRNL